MSPEVNKATKLLVPIAITGIGTSAFYDAKKDWRIMVGIAVFIYIAAYLFTTQMLSIVDDISNKPKGRSIDESSTGKIPVGFNASNWSKRIHDDVYNPFWRVRSRDADLYHKLAKMNDSQLIAISNDWNSKYYNLHDEHISQAIGQEFIIYPLSSTANKVKERFSKIENNDS